MLKNLIDYDWRVYSCSYDPLYVLNILNTIDSVYDIDISLLKGIRLETTKKDNEKI